MTEAPADARLPTDISEDAKILLNMIFARQRDGESTLDKDLIEALGWKKGRYTDARAELEDTDKVQPIFLPVPLVAMLADGMATLAREVLRDGLQTKMWLAQPQEYRDWLITQTSNVISNRWSTPKDFHENRRAQLIDAGWKYGDTTDHAKKISSDIRPWEEMEVWYKLTYITFVNAVRILAREPRG